MKKISAEDVDFELTGKYEIKNDVMSTTNELLRVNINFNDGDNGVTYYSTTQTLSYSNPDIEEDDASILLYNSNDKYKILDKQSDHDIERFYRIY